MKNGQNYNSALCPVSITDSVPAYEAAEVWVQIPSGAPFACLFQLVEKADSKSA